MTKSVRNVRTSNLRVLVVSRQFNLYDTRMGKLSDRFEMRCNRTLTDAIDKWRSGQRPIPSRAEAIRMLVSRAIITENLLGLILFESGRELSAANRIGPETSLEIYERWAQVIRQSLDRIGREQSSSSDPHDGGALRHFLTPETHGEDIPEPKSLRATR